MDDITSLGSLTLNQAYDNEPEGVGNVTAGQPNVFSRTTQPGKIKNLTITMDTTKSTDSSILSDDDDIMIEVISDDDMTIAQSDSFDSSSQSSVHSITVLSDDETDINQSNFVNNVTQSSHDEESDISQSHYVNNVTQSSHDEETDISQSNFVNYVTQSSHDEETDVSQSNFDNYVTQSSHDEEITIVKENIPSIVKYQITHDYTQLPNEPESVNVFYANTRSIRKKGKLDELKCIIKMIPKTVHLMLITETWANEEDKINSSLEIENYILVLGNKVGNKHGGGVAAYIRQDVRYSYTEVTYRNGNNYLWVFFDDPRLNIGVVYYPGNTSEPDFLKDFKQQLTKQKACNAIVLGDFNINVLEPKKSSKFENVLKETEFKILNYKSEEYFTRKNIMNHIITKMSVIDLVCSNIKGIECHLALIDSTLSDHRQVYFEIRNPKQFLRNQPPKYENIQNIQIVNKNSKDVTQGDWITDEICKSITEKNLCFQNYQKCPTEAAKMRLKIAKKAVREEIMNNQKRK